MNLLRHCECCECPQAEGAEWFIGAEGEDICAHCAAALLGAERDALRLQLRGAVAALERLANPTHRPRSDEAALLQAEAAQIAQAALDALGGQYAPRPVDVDVHSRPDSGARQEQGT